MRWENGDKKFQPAVHAQGTVMCTSLFVHAREASSQRCEFHGCRKILQDQSAKHF